MVQFTTAYKTILSGHDLYATGTTGLKIQEATGLSVERFQSGPLGGDQQIGALIAANALDLVIFCVILLRRSRTSRMFRH